MEKINGTIYLHRNKINGKCYIGQTIKQPKLRWGSDGCGYKTQPKFYRAIQKYGWDSFEHIILEKNINTREELNEKEIYYIEKYDSLKNGYNATAGGDNISEKCYKQVRCITTGREFDSVNEGAKYYSIKASSNISLCCEGKQLRAGMAGGQKLDWEYIEENLNRQYKEAKKEIETKLTNREVTCITTGQTFANPTEGAIFYNLKSISHLTQCCRGERKHAGKYKGKFLQWCYTSETRKQIYEEAKEVRDAKINPYEEKQVRCITTDVIFNTIAEAGYYYNISKSNIAQCCRGNKRSAGQFNNTKLDWEYVEESLKLQFKNKKEELANLEYKKQVKCVTTGLVFDSIAEASKYYNITASNIGSCCRGKKKTAGKLLGGTPLTWEYVDTELNDKFKLKKEEMSKEKCKRKVRCIETNKVFDSVSEAGRYYNIHYVSISNCCRGYKSKTAGGYHWEYIKEDK